MTGDGWFRTPPTRPLRWALPLAVLGWVVLLVVPLVTAVTGDRDDCWSGWRSVETSDGVEVLEPTDEARDCMRRRNVSVAVAVPLFLVLQLPLTVIAIRGFVWGANTLHDLAARSEENGDREGSWGGSSQDEPPH